MKGGHQQRGCACQHLFRKVLAKCGCCYSRVRESYSAADSDGSISTSVASIQPQASTSSAPSSPGSKRSVSTLKKWLTTPVRKFSSGKVEQQVKKLESRPKRGADARRKSVDEGKKSIDLGLAGKQEEPAAFLRDSRDTEWKEDPDSCRIFPDEQDPETSVFADLLQGERTGQHSLAPSASYLPGDPNSSVPADTFTSQSSLSADSEEERKSALEKSLYVLKELVETEKLYVTDLGFIVEGYMATMNAKGIPEEMKGKDKIVFGNIHQIYDWHKDYFLGELEKCIEEPERLAELFIKHERRLHMYVVYCQNKPKSEHIVSEYIDTYFEELKQQLRHRLQLNDLLIKPVQRIMKYQLLLKDFLKYYKKAGMDTTQLEVLSGGILFSPLNVQYLISLSFFDLTQGKLTAQGKLLQQDTFHVTEQDGGFLSRSKERRIFLFEQIIIFSEPIDKKKGFSLPGYIFKNSIKVSCLSFGKSVDNDPCKFALMSRGTDGNSERYVLQAATPEMKQAWLSDISQILETQRNFLNALQSPIEYQRKESKSNSLGRYVTSRSILTTSATMRPHSSASMDRNKLPSLKSYNASLPSLYLPCHSNQEKHQANEIKNQSAKSKYLHRGSTSSSDATCPAHINLDFSEPSGNSPPKQISNGVQKSEHSSKVPDWDEGLRPSKESCPRTPILAKLDEDEL
uniref:Rho guanine nucleotide exchange factor 25 n=1 Tax=Latimeria chalumnae TaxID=7897 RepID=H3BGL7_LATCH